MHLAIYGPEGSGKGTQALKLSQKYNLPVITSGDLVRYKAKEGSDELSRACKEALLKGVYVEDKWMYKLWENKLKDRDLVKGFILDGFPRNVKQAEFLSGRLKGADIPLDIFLHLKINETESRKRLKKRNRSLFAGSKVKHDTPQKISSRLESFRKEESAILNYYRNLGILLEVDAAGTVDGVFESIERKLSGITGR